jgi:hypothetical protein
MEAGAARGKFAHVTPPPEEGQTRVVDVRCPEASALLADQQNHPTNPQIEPAPPYIHPPGRYSPSQLEPTFAARSTSCSDSAAASQSCGSVQAQEPSGPAEWLQTADESTPPALAVQGPNQGSPQIQRQPSDKCHPTRMENEVYGGLHRGESAQKPYPEISWEGWGLIKTPDGFYLPETFSPFPHELEDLTDQRYVVEGYEGT